MATATAKSAIALITPPPRLSPYSRRVSVILETDSADLILEIFQTSIPFTGGPYLLELARKAGQKFYRYSVE
jgi:hypothetical protein